MSLDFTISNLFFFLSGMILSGVVLRLVFRRSFIIADREAKHILKVATQEEELIRRQAYLDGEGEWQKKEEMLRHELDQKKNELIHEQVFLDTEHVKLKKREKDLEEQSRAVFERDNHLRGLERALKEQRTTLINHLNAVTGLDASSAKQMLFDQVKLDCENEVRLMKKDFQMRADEELEEKAKNMLITVMQRIAMPVTSSLVNIARVNLSSEDIKGRLIGKEGRNIRTFENATGVTLLIDDTPNTVLVSSFDPVRREIARLALEVLVNDGRIQPASIEEEVAKAREQVDATIVRIGQQALSEAKIFNVSQEMLRLLGSLEFRLSNNQNTLKHSLEVAYLCSMLASELGMDAELAKRIGLFHDIGKALDHEYEEGHAIIGAKILERNNEPEIVVSAVASHHGDKPVTSMYGALLLVADAVSASRPGARSESADGLVRRMRELETLCKSINGVVEAFVLQAGREIRVLVAPEKVSDDGARQIAHSIRLKVEDNVDYKSPIRITVIRENRFVETAR